MSEALDNLAGMTREQLVAEIERLRDESRAAKASDGGNEPGQEKVTRAVREELTTKVEFIFDLDVVEARGLNISETGIAFILEKPPPVELRINHEGEDHLYKAELVRTQRDPNGGFLMGLRFAGKLELPPLPDAPDEDSPTITF